MKRLLILAGALIGAGCADVTSAPSARHRVPQAPRWNLTCRSGYAVAYNSDGTAYCAPTDSTATTTTTTTTTTATTTTTS